MRPYKADVEKKIQRALFANYKYNKELIFMKNSQHPTIASNNFPSDVSGACVRATLLKPLNKRQE